MRHLENMAFFAAVLIVIAPCPAGAVAWEYDVITYSNAYSGSPDLRLDSHGVPHISYTYGSSQTNPVRPLRYGYWRPGSWYTSQVAADPNHFHSLDLGSDDQPHIVFQEHNPSGADALVYRYRSGTTWFSEYLETSIYRWNSTRLRVDDSDGVHLLTHNTGRPNGDELVYQWKPAGGSWSTVLTGPGPTDLAVLALAGDGSPAIVYRSSATSLHYRAPDPSGSGQWPSESVPATAPDEMDLAFDGQIPHVVFYDHLTLVHAEKQGSTWVTTVIDPSAVNGVAEQVNWPSLAVGANGDVHVAYIDAVDKEMRYARRTGGTWQVEVLHTTNSTNPNTFMAPSLDLDVFGNPHIVYYDATRDDTYYVAQRDCDGDGISDSDEYAAGTAEDCNGNGIPDNCDVLTGAATDCNGNGIGDDCETDCNGNGVPDDCDVAQGTSSDCNGNGNPDVCDLTDPSQDCDGNGILDVCEFGITRIDDPATGPNTYGEFGHAIATGDLNDDGLGDVVVGAPELGDDLMGGVYRHGAAYVYFGPVLASQPPDLQIIGASLDNLGYSLAVGDVDGDGIDDLVTGSPSGEYWGYGHAGRVDVFLGGPSLSTTPSYSIPDPSGSGYPMFGSAVAVVDVNGDNHGDVVVGAKNSGSNEGEVSVFLSNPPQMTPVQTWTGEQWNNYFGFRVANAGDLDGNNLDDIVVGAYGAAPAAAGRAYVFFSQPGPSFTAGPVLIGEGAGAYLGVGLGGAGDFNADGFDDLLVGAPYYDGADTETGRAYLHLGGPAMDAVADLVFDPISTATDRYFHIGSGIGPADDLNGDGITDIIIGADQRGVDNAFVYVYFGNALPDAVPDVIFRSGYQDRAGYAVAAAGDTDGDGAAEFLIGAPWFSSNNGRAILCEILMPHFGDCNGNGVSDACDIAQGMADADGDGVPDVCSLSAVGDSEPPTRPRLIGAFPTPFNPRTQIRFELDRIVAVNLRVYDLSGKLIRTLASRETFGPGRHALPWLGRDDNGHQVASGVYFFRLEAGEFSETKSLVLLK